MKVVLKVKFMYIIILRNDKGGRYTIKNEKDGCENLC